MYRRILRNGLNFDFWEKKKNENLWEKKKDERKTSEKKKKLMNTAMISLIEIQSVFECHLKKKNHL